MYIFLDESGDLGFNFDNSKTTKFFAITLLVCETREALYIARKAIQQTLNRKLNHGKKRQKQEVKGNSTTLAIKQHFYKKLAERSDIKIHSIILNKKRLLTQIDHIDQHRIYVKMSYSVLKNVNIKSDTSFVHIIADRCKRGIEAKDFSHTLRSDVEKLLPLTSSVKMEQIPSKKDFGLQAVDLFSYGVFCKHEFNDVAWYEIFEDKISSETLI